MLGEGDGVELAGDADLLRFGEEVGAVGVYAGDFLHDVREEGFDCAKLQMRERERMNEGVNWERTSS